MPKHTQRVQFVYFVSNLYLIPDIQLSNISFGLSWRQCTAHLISASPLRLVWLRTQSWSGDKEYNVRPKGGSLSKAPSGNWEVIFSKQNSGCNKSPGSHSSVTVRSPPFSARDKEFGRSNRLLFLFYSGDFQVCSAERVGVSLKGRFSLVSVWQEKAVRLSQTCGYRDLQHDQGPVVLL